MEKSAGVNKAPLNLRVKKHLYLLSSRGLKYSTLFGGGVSALECTYRQDYTYALRAPNRALKVPFCLPAQGGCQSCMTCQCLLTWQLISLAGSVSTLECFGVRLFYRGYCEFQFAIYLSPIEGGDINVPFFICSLGLFPVSSFAVLIILASLPSCPVWASSGLLYG